MTRPRRPPARSGWVGSGQVVEDAVADTAEHGGDLVLVNSRIGPSGLSESRTPITRPTLANSTQLWLGSLATAQSPGTGKGVAQLLTIFRRTYCMMPPLR